MPSTQRESFCQRLPHHLGSQSPGAVDPQLDRSHGLQPEVEAKRRGLPERLVNKKLDDGLKRGSCEQRVGTAIPAWLCPLDTVLAIHRSQTTLGGGRTRARVFFLTSSARGQRLRPQAPAAVSARTPDPPPPRNSRGRTWSPRRPRPLQGPDSRAGRGLRPGASRALRSPPPAPSGRLGPGPTSARPVQPPTVSPRPGCAPNRMSCDDPSGSALHALPSRASEANGRPPLASRGDPQRAPPDQPRAGPALLAPRRAGAHRPGRRPRPTFVRQPLQAEREVPPPAPHPGGRPAARPGLSSPAPPPPGPAAQRSAGEGRAPRARRAWAAAEGRGARAAAKRSARLRSQPLSRGAPRARAFPGAGARRPGPAGAARSAAGGAPAAA
ncbi:translation initiation factor IF-2-like [Cervus elaphus]|uniref:translation initiation factor IF-2-like n=1 Tax=Cervus elaphus TaxID=9860 RepID=UPI001CC2991F|nr:translation initiation factor IF-2-like [Cervus elaphus]